MIKVIQFINTYQNERIINYNNVVLRLNYNNKII